MRYDADSVWDVDEGLTRSEADKYGAIYGETLTPELEFMGELTPSTWHTDCGLYGCKVIEGEGSKCGMAACSLCGTTLDGRACECGGAA